MMFINMTQNSLFVTFQEKNKHQSFVLFKKKYLSLFRYFLFIFVRISSFVSFYQCQNISHLTCFQHKILLFVSHSRLVCINSHIEYNIKCHCNVSDMVNIHKRLQFKGWTLQTIATEVYITWSSIGIWSTPTENEFFITH